jgi:DHA2 family methylenomycin A resistance protein-like MFS transporter
VIGHHSIDARWRVLIVMCVGYFLVLLDVTIVNVAIPAVGRDLGAGVDGLQWVVDGYAVPLAAFLIVGGALGDARGHRRVVLVGLAIFGAASLACGLAPSEGVLVGCRVAQGVGAALLLPGTLAIISDVFPEPGERARAIGVWAAVGSAALPAGPLLGGLLVESVGWRAVFLVNVPIVVVAGIVAAHVVRDGAAAERRVDWMGATLGATCLAATVFAVVEVGHTGASLGAALAGGLAIAALGGFVTVERRTTHPMLPLGLFRRPSFTAANAVAGTMNFGTLGLLFVLALYLQEVQGRSALEAGVAMLPLFLPLSILAPIAGRATGRWGARGPMVLGLLIAAGGVLALSWASEGSSGGLLVPALLAWGVGIGLLTPAVVAASLASVGPGRSGLAAGVNNTARQAAGAVGIAAYGAVAGPPGQVAAFVHGLRIAGIGTAALFVAAAAVTVRFVPRPLAEPVSPG